VALEAVAREVRPVVQCHHRETPALPDLGVRRPFDHRGHAQVLTFPEPVRVDPVAPGACAEAVPGDLPEVVAEGLAVAGLRRYLRKRAADGVPRPAAIWVGVEVEAGVQELLAR